MTYKIFGLPCTFGDKIDYMHLVGGPYYPKLLGNMVHPKRRISLKLACHHMNKSGKETKFHCIIYIFAFVLVTIKLKNSM